MSWQEIVRQLHAMYENEKHCIKADLYIAEEAERLNARLFKIIGRNYGELPVSLIENCLS